MAVGNGFWHKLEPFMPTKHNLNITAYSSIVVHHLQPFIGVCLLQWPQNVQCEKANSKHGPITEGKRLAEDCMSFKKAI